jgi:hypothetical protein
VVQVAAQLEAVLQRARDRKQNTLGRRRRWRRRRQREGQGRQRGGRGGRGRRHRRMRAQRCDHLGGKGSPADDGALRHNHLERRLLKVREVRLGRVTHQQAVVPAVVGLVQCTYWFEAGHRPPILGRS